MELSALLLFAGALLVNSGSPGPSIAALVARVLTSGWRNALPFAAAMWIGEAAWLIAAVIGLAALAETFHWVFVTIKWCGVAYLLTLAWHMWHAPVAAGEPEAELKAGSAMRMFLTGLTVTLGNPKIMVFYLALLPTLIDLGRVGALGLVELTAVMIAVLAATDIAWMIAASRARRLLRSQRAMRITNRVSAGAMAGAAAAIATR
ncbi:MAG: LysE family translocator [Hyphomicrobiaceae bacterium]